MPITITATVTRRLGLTHEEFIEEWKRHGTLIKNLKVVQERTIRYSQFHPNTTHTSSLQSLGLNIIDFDGLAEWVVEQWDDFMAVMGDAEYHQVGVPDEERFIERTAFRVIVGDVNVVWEKEKETEKAV